MRTIRQFIRNFNKQKVVGLLGIGSLGLGIMVSLLTGLWAINEMSFDNFHPGGDRMYRVIMRARMNDAEIRGVLSHSWLGERAKERLPEVEDAVWAMIGNFGGDVTNIVVDDVFYSDVDHMAATPNFFTFFNFPLKEGDPVTSFPDGSNVIVSESAVNKYFDGGDAMGRAVIVDGHAFTVSGIMYDAPSNSHLRPEMVFPFAGKWEGWDGDIFSTYLLLGEGADTEKIAGQLTEIMYEGAPDYKSFGSVLEIEPLRDIHFADNLMYDPAVKGDRKTITTFLLVSLVILIISCINFMNLFVSTSFLRARTIGIKKTMGAGRFSLMLDFYGETAIYVLISLVAGIFLAAVCMPVFNSIVHTNISMDITSPRLWIFAAVLTLAVIAMAGSFPALYMTRFGIMETLREKFRGKNMSFLQKTFLVMQFSAAAFLLIVVTFFGRQVDHMLAADLGFDRENIVYVAATDRFGGDNFASVREELLREPSITGVTERWGLPTVWNTGFPVKVHSDDNDIVTEMIGVSQNYFDFMGMQLVEGENPLREDNPWSRDVVINESAAKVLGLDDPVGSQIQSSFYEGPFTIRGVVKNARTRALHTEIEPQIYVDISFTGSRKYIFFKIDGDPRSALSAIEDKWKSTDTGRQPFEFHFLDQTHAELYRAETDSRNVLGYALIITLLITVAGLFAMAYFSMQRRVKEVGIRKINGATLGDLMLLLNRNMFSLIAVSFAIGTLASLVFLRDWLTGFVERTPLSVWIFLAAGALIFAVALLTVSYQTWKTATANPVESLKSE